MPTTVVKGPWGRTPPATPPQETRSHPLVLAVLVTVVVLMAGWMAYQAVVAEVRPTNPSESLYAGPGWANGLTDGRYYPDTTIQTGVWQTNVSHGQECGYTSNSLASGPSEGFRTTPGQMTVAITSSYVWVEFTGGCTWYRADR